MSKDLWSIEGKDHTRLKHSITRATFSVWLTIWNAQNWIENTIYVVDLFAGPGYCYNKEGKIETPGSPIIFLEEIHKKKETLKRSGICVEMFLVESNKKAFEDLKANTEKFIKENGLGKIVKIKYYNDDCNTSIDDILHNIKNTEKRPVFFFVDPWGLQIDKLTIKKITSISNKKDIVMNYMVGSINRVAGVYRKVVLASSESLKDKNTAKTLEKFFGDAIEPYQEPNKARKDSEALINYCDVFLGGGLTVVLSDIKYKNQNKTIYVLLFACSNDKIANVIDGVIKKEKEKKSSQRVLIEKMATKVLPKRKK